MMHRKRMPCLSVFIRSVSCLLVVVFSLTSIFPPSVFAQSLPLLQLPAPGSMIFQTPGYVPALLKGVVIDPQNPLSLDFIVDTGDSGLEAEALRQETLLLIKYFLAALTVPEEEMWVNLSPNEPDRIIPQIFGRTAMGMELLAQDYLLKQMTSSLLYPEEETGKKFWQRVRAQAQARFGTSEISTDIFNKVWIVPDKATVYQKGNGAFVVESRLRVMMEEDYHALRRVHGSEP
ncbi:MAG TPA: hypothetical protein VLJ10_00015, partial [Candidatus Bathyarchaeia archaeon]|nr:hypothetical protein [Candidatus Bathyarchaeia archaeon]